MRRGHALLAYGLLTTVVSVIITVGGSSAAHAASFQDWSTVASGGYHVCGIRHGGELYCWGDYLPAAIDDDIDDALAPRRLGAFADWSTIAANSHRTCGIRHGGKLYCWGLDVDGALGDGGSDSAVAAPKRIGSFADWSTVATGRDHTCGIRHGGKLYCWGSDDWGQLGDGGDLTNVDAPKRIGSSVDWSTVATGGHHTCGIRHGGKLYCWGKAGEYQVGDGGIVSTVRAPKAVGTFEDWGRVTAGYYHTCGIRHGGKLYCWGSDNGGQIGDGEATTEASVPRRIGKFEDWSEISAGDRHTCGIRHGGKLYCWGNDSQGEVGDGGPDVDVIAPKRIGSFEDWVVISAGLHHTCGVRRNSKLYCWGADTDGELGDGETTGGASSPRRI